MKRKLYFAYGSNLSVEQMARRCPDAEPIGYIELKDWKLVFRGVADVIMARGASVYGGVWWISEADERALDLYEGIRTKLYRKVYLPIHSYKGEQDMLMYVMNSDGIFPPAQSYLDGIADGYRDFHIPDKGKRMLYDAVQASWDHKRPTERERWRYLCKGYPRLAKPMNRCANCGFCPRKQPKQLTLLRERRQADEPIR